MELLERIKLIMKMNQLNAASFADRIGVQRSNVSHILTGRNKPSLDFIEKTLLQFPKINAAWLITGQIQQADIIHPEIQGEMLFEEKEEIKNVTNVPIQGHASKRVLKVITFYDDFTFDEYRPNR